MVKAKDAIQRLKNEIKKLKELAYKDELTNLFNRRGFKEGAEKFIKEVISFRQYPEKRKSLLVKNFSLVIFDIDNFKKFNDYYGHQAGDQVLKILSKLILERVRDIDVVARWGGEEIILGLVGANENDAFHVAEDIRKKVAETKFKWRKKTLRFTISGGVAGSGGVKKFDDLFLRADQALHQAKKEGKNLIIKSKEKGKAQE